MKTVMFAAVLAAQTPGLRRRAELGTLHGSAGMRAGRLASDGDAALSLFIVALT